MPRVKLFNEEKVLQKAMLIFWENGYYNTSIQDLVTGLGINRASLYDTYGGKKEIFVSALEVYLQNGRESLEMILKTKNGAEENIRQLFESIIEQDYNDQSQKGCFAVNTITELSVEHPDIKNIMTMHNKFMEASFHKILLQGVETGEIDDNKDLKSISRLMYVVLMGLRVLGKTKPDKKDSLAAVNVALALLN